MSEQIQNNEDALSDAQLVAYCKEYARLSEEAKAQRNEVAEAQSKLRSLEEAAGSITTRLARHLRQRDSTREVVLMSTQHPFSVALVEHLGHRAYPSAKATVEFIDRAVC